MTNLQGATTEPSHDRPHDRPHDRHRVVVIGSGFGGLFGTKALRRADVDVTMVAKTTHHLFQPLLYQVATGILSEGEIAPPTREVLRRQKNAGVCSARSPTSTSRPGPSPPTCWTRRSSRHTTR